MFFDGGCGLCHRFVAFLVARDRRHAFDYAPLHGETFLRVVPADRRATLPDSTVVATSDGRLLTKSRAVAETLLRLPAAWPLFGHALRALPVAIGDRAYDAVAARRARLVKAPASACPIVPAPWRDRFLA